MTIFFFKKKINEEDLESLAHAFALPQAPSAACSAVQAALKVWRLRSVAISIFASKAVTFLGPNSTVVL